MIAKTSEADLRRVIRAVPVDLREAFFLSGYVTAAYAITGLVCDFEPAISSLTDPTHSKSSEATCATCGLVPAPYRPVAGTDLRMSLTACFVSFAANMQERSGLAEC